MRVLPLLCVVIVAAVAKAQDSAPQSPTPQPAAKPIRVEFYWGESRPVPGLTAEKGIAWNESGGMLYLHKQPILTNSDVTKVDVHKTVFGGNVIPSEQFTIYFQLTREARKRLAETCGPSGDKVLAAFVDGQHGGNPYYLKSRDESSFVPFAGMFSSKAMVDRVVATFAPTAKASKDPAPRSEKPPPAGPGIKVEFRWAEFKPVRGRTEEKGVPFGEEGSSLVYLHKQAVLTNEDIAEARVGGEFTFGVGDRAKKLYGVSVYLSPEGKQKLARAGEPGTKKLLALLVDGRNTSTLYVDVADLSRFIVPVGFYEKSDAERITEGIAAGIKRLVVPDTKAQDSALQPPSPKS